MRDRLTKRVEIALIRYNPQVTIMEARPQPDWRLRLSEETRDEEEKVSHKQRGRLMSRRHKRVRQV